LNAEPRELLRVRLGRDPNLSAGIVGSQPVKTTGVGGKERGFDPAKEVGGRKRHLLVDTEGLVLEARVHSARAPDQDGVRLPSEQARGRLARLSNLRVDAGHRGRGKRWVEGAMGVGVEVVREPPKPVPGKVAEVWAGEWGPKEGKKADWQRPTPPRGFHVLPRGWWSAPSRG
jgi:putative transposase